MPRSWPSMIFVRCRARFLMSSITRTGYLACAIYPLWVSWEPDATTVATTDATTEDARMTPQHDELTVDLDIEGMTCASCVSRVERRLERIGVHAQVNLATERARVRYAPGVQVDELVEAVRSAGYAASVST